MATVTRTTNKPISDKELKAQVRELVKKLLNPTKEEAEAHIVDLKARITEYERRYEMPSAQMLEGLESGKVRETAEIVLWAMDWREYRRIVYGTPWFEGEEEPPPPPPVSRMNGKRKRTS